MFKLEIEPAETLHTKFGTAKIDNKGYYRITTRKEGNNGKFLHRLIFEDFYGPIPDGCHIHHKDGDKLNNCILNLQLLSESQHHSLHKPSEETKRKMSEARNTSSHYRVYKTKKPTCKQGFLWSYQYSEDGKHKIISSVSLEKLEIKVKRRGLLWMDL